MEMKIIKGSETGSLNSHFQYCTFCIKAHFFSEFTPAFLEEFHSEKHENIWLIWTRSVRIQTFESSEKSSVSCYFTLKVWVSSGTNKSKPKPLKMRFFFIWNFTHGCYIFSLMLLSEDHFSALSDVTHFLSHPEVRTYSNSVHMARTWKLP